jgi:hypothetical protein
MRPCIEPYAAKLFLNKGNRCASDAAFVLIDLAVTIAKDSYGLEAGLMAVLYFLPSGFFQAQLIIRP